MKWILIILAFVASLAVGYAFSLKYKKRAKFFKGLVMLAQKLDLGINFSRERLLSIISGLDDSLKSDLCGVQSNYCHYLEGQGELTPNELFKGISWLKESEKEVVFMFFKMLGRSDVDSQSKEIKNFEARFEEFSSSASQDNKKYGGLCIKLGVIVGLVSVIILW